MNTLLHHHVAVPSPFPLHITRAPPVFRSPKPLRAQGRGFGAAGISDARKRSEIKEGLDEKNGGGGGGGRDDDEIPQAVFDRMLRRIAAWVGAPMAVGVGTLCALGLLKQGRVWEAPPWVPFVAALLAFGTSAFGIAYGTLSTSWDPEDEGSALGWEEARRNWPQLWKEEDDDS